MEYDKETLENFSTHQLRMLAWSHCNIDTAYNMPRRELISSILASQIEEPMSYILSTKYERKNDPKAYRTNRWLEQRIDKVTTDIKNGMTYLDEHKVYNIEVIFSASVNDYISFESIEPSGDLAGLKVVLSEECPPNLTKEEDEEMVEDMILNAILAREATISWKKRSRN